MVNKISIASGIQIAYENLHEKDTETFYVCTDTHNVYLGVNLIFEEDIFKYLIIDEFNSVELVFYGPSGTITVSFPKDYNNVAEVLDAIELALSLSYKLIGIITSGEITSNLLSYSNERDVYCVSYGFTIGSGQGQISKSLFVDSVSEGEYPLNTYIAVVNIGTLENPIHKFDILDNWEGGGGTTTSDYDELTNKPQINSVTLSGNLSASDLGLATPEDIPEYKIEELMIPTTGYLKSYQLTKDDSSISGSATIDIPKENIEWIDF